MIFTDRGMFARTASEHDALNSMIDHLGTGTINPPTKEFVAGESTKDPAGSMAWGKPGDFLARGGMDCSAASRRSQ
jgi:hypothetical protein